MDNPHNPALPWFPCETVDRAWFDTAPVRYRTVAELPASPTQLFDSFEDPASWPRWATGIGGVTWTSEPPFGVGTTRTVRFWGGMEVYERFFLWDRGREMAFCFEGTTQDVWTSFAEHYAVEDLGDRCRLTWTVAYAPNGVFRTLHPLIRPVMGVNFRTYLWRLKGELRRTVTGRTAAAPTAR